MMEEDFFPWPEDKRSGEPKEYGGSSPKPPPIPSHLDDEINRLQAETSTWCHCRQPWYANGDLVAALCATITVLSIAVALALFLVWGVQRTLW